MKNIINQNNIILTYFIYLIIGHIFFLNIHLNEFPFKYVFTDWLINYEGGFVRKGLLGQIVFKIATYTNLELKLIIFCLQVAGYVSYLVLIFNFLRKIKFNFFWILLTFSTISFLYPLSELEALGRKDIYVILCFLIFTLINFDSIKKIILSFLIIFTISTLIHEISLFFLPYYLIVIFVKFYFNLKLKINLNYVFILSAYILYLVYLNLIVSERVNIDQIINGYKILDLDLHKSLGAFSWLSKSLKENLFNIFATISIKYVLRYSYILLINIWIIVYFLKLKNKIFLYSKEFDIIQIFSSLVLLSLPIYLIVLDWGRVTYLSFNFMLILIIFFYKQNLIDIDYLNSKTKNISFKAKVVIFVLICFMYSPKILINDDFSGLPLYKTINKFQKNIKLL